MNDNFMIFNDKDIDISKIELDKSDLRISDKSGKYVFRVFVYYNWKDINNIKVGEKKNINFNEYFLIENNEPALVWPDICTVEKISNDSICFYAKFENKLNNITYMFERGCFDIEPKSLEVKVFINYKDAKGDSIIYKF